MKTIVTFAFASLVVSTQAFAWCPDLSGKYYCKASELSAPNEVEIATLYAEDWVDYAITTTRGTRIYRANGVEQELPLNSPVDRAVYVASCDGYTDSLSITLTEERVRENGTSSYARFNMSFKKTAEGYLQITEGRFSKDSTELDLLDTQTCVKR